MQEEVSNKTVTLVIRATKLTSGVPLSAIKAYMRHHDQKKTQKKTRQKKKNQLQQQHQKKAQKNRQRQQQQQRKMNRPNQRVQQVLIMDLQTQVL